MKLYTKTGDDGATGLFGGDRVRKDHARVTAYGYVDELNAVLGVVAVGVEDESWRAELRGVQGELFQIGAALATPGEVDPQFALNVAAIERLEALIDALTVDLPPLKSFVLPGGGQVAAQFQWARTVCRRAERAIVTLSADAPVAPEVLAYMNRLSDWLFACALAGNHRAGIPEVTWP